MKNSLSLDQDILKVLKQRPFFSTYFSIKRANNTEKTYRYTVIISKKVHKLAVQRNLIKRRIRAFINENKNKITPVDFTISVKNTINSLSAKEQKEEIRKSLLKSKILND